MYQHFFVWFINGFGKCNSTNHTTLVAHQIPTYLFSVKLTHTKYKLHIFVQCSSRNFCMKGWLVFLNVWKSLLPTPNIQKSLSHVVSAKQTIQKSLNMLSGIMWFSIRWCTIHWKPLYDSVVDGSKVNPGNLLCTCSYFPTALSR
jgi:hypothetical protein